MCISKFLSLTFSIFLAFIIACTNSQGEESDTISEDPVLTDSLMDWNSWAESTGDGLCVDDAYPMLEKVDEYNGEDYCSFYQPSTIAVQDSFIYIADQSKESMVCFNFINKEVKWTFGESGEGPGHFSRIGHISCGDDAIFVGNMQNNRIEIVSYSGDYLGSYNISSPFDMAVFQDSVLAVTSTTEDNLVTLFNTNTGERIGSFGEWESGNDVNVGFSNRNMLVCPINDSLLAVASFYESRIAIFDILNEEFVSDFYRELPFTIEDNEPGTFRIHIVDLFTYSDSVLCVVLPALTIDRKPVTNETINLLAELTVVDRYSISGDYLDSFVIPENCLEVLKEDNRFFLANPLTSNISVYELSRISSE
jgi:hypothetical protein